MGMASVRTTFTLDSELAERARRMNINISAAARRGVTEAVREAFAEADRSAYERMPERTDPAWSGAAAWDKD